MMTEQGVGRYPYLHRQTMLFSTRPLLRVCFLNSPCICYLFGEAVRARLLLFATCERQKRRPSCSRRSSLEGGAFSAEPLRRSLPSSLFFPLSRSFKTSLARLCQYCYLATRNSNCSSNRCSRTVVPVIPVLTIGTLVTNCMGKPK